MPLTLRNALSGPLFRALLGVAGFGPTAALSARVLSPLPPGTSLVGSTSLAVDVPEGAPIADYLLARNGRYVGDILAEPSAALTFQVEVPARSRVYGAWAGQTVPFVAYVLYPTDQDNDRPDYRFPYAETGDAVVPRMQRAGEAPRFADPAARYPLIVYSGGYNTHGLWHLGHLKPLAADGCIVLDVFHGDGRGRDFLPNLALRVLALRTAVELLLAHPDFGPRIDRDRLAFSGASGGAHTVLALLGGRGAEDEPVPALEGVRVRAAFVVVPFLGGELGFWPFKLKAWVFGQDHAGLRHVQVPVLAVYGEADTNVPRAGVEAGLRALGGPATGVLLAGEAHDLSDAAVGDTWAWERLFFAAHLRDDADARAQWEKGTSMTGGVSDQAQRF